MLREKRKNVRATIRGELANVTTKGESWHFMSATPLTVTYNPYKTDCFVGEDNNGFKYKMDVADHVTIDSRGVIAWLAPRTLMRLERL